MNDQVNADCNEQVSTSLTDTDSMKDIDTIIEETYGNGAYQITYVATVGVIGLVCMAELLSTSFIKYTPKVLCSNYGTPILNTSYVDGCDLVKQNISCSSWNYSTSVMKRSLITDHQMLCDNDPLLPMLDSGYLLFSGFGYMLSMLGDILGRRPIFLMLLILEIVSMIAFLFSNNIIYIITVRCVRGLDAGFKHFAMACLSELLPIKRRSVILTSWWLHWCFGALFIGLMAYLTRDWFYLRVTMLIPLAIYPAFIFIQMESPRWLLLNGRVDDALKVFQRIAMFNKAKLPDKYFEKIRSSYEDDLYEKSKINGQSVEHPQEKESLLDVFKNAVIMKRLTIFLVTGAFISFSYFGLLTTSQFLNDNIFLNASLFGMIEMPALFSMYALLHFTGCRTSSITAFVIAAVCVVSSELLQAYPTIKYILANIAMVGSTCALTIFNVYILECMPTSIRASSMQMQVTNGLLLSSAAPYLNDAVSTYPLLRGSVYCTILLVGAVLIFIYLPETKGCPLSQTIEEASKLKKGNEKEWSEMIRLQNRVFPIEQ